jgi:hypothetical protein
VLGGCGVVVEVELELDEEVVVDGGALPRVFR